VKRTPREGESPAPQIRRAETARDFARFHGLLIEYEASLAPDLRHGVVLDLASLESTYRERNAAFLATSGDDAFGCVALSELSSTTALILRLFVRQELRGSGAGRKLVVTALEFARGKGHARVVLDTDKERLRPAYELYRSLGFTECAPYGQVDYQRPTFMELALR
jgi:GNAT superfamily N-acetyltransferase